MLKLATFLAINSFLSGVAGAQTMQGYGGYGQHQVQGYTSQSGTYVQPHMQTNPNSTMNDNWSSRGNSNPYTGQPGYVTPRY